ncbi:reverse transcriptase [Phytophthora megakarya]|uniref:Reverse transcriptase n=1 Tax=Phytophthora megakarya TaxID=4795 RepID=A0A225V6Z4_9STRA|nr:reverse transcriptase [Phytophthora megakarya]
MKHLAKKTRSIAEWIDRGHMKMEYVPTAENVADIFTKALGPCVFERLRDQLNIENVQEAWLSEDILAVTVATAHKNERLRIECASYR